MNFHVELRAPGWVRAIGAVVLVAGVAALVLTIVVVGRDAPAAAPGVALAVLFGGAVGVLMLRARIVVSVTDHEVDLRFPPLFHQVFGGDEITDVRAVQVSPASFGGTGLRLAPGRRTGLFFSGGPGVEIAATDGRRYSIVVPNRDALLAAVERVRSATSS